MTRFGAARILLCLSLVLGWPSIRANNAQDKTVGPEKKKQESRFDRWDKNGDGKLERKELPDPLKRNFSRVDANGDGFISRKEDADYLKRRVQRQNPIQPKDPVKQSGARSLKDIAYVKNGHERQKLDLYYFEDKGKKGNPSPLVIWIHGGAWRAGSKDRCPATFLLEHGFAVASINYRLSQHALFPAQIQDCKSAIAWLKTNAQDYNLDAKHVGVWGSSAGGHLSALVGTSANVLEWEPGDKTKDQSRVQAVCDWFGPTDILLMNKHAGKQGVMDHDAPNSPESNLIGGAIQENKPKANRVNPIRYITKDDPPFLIMHGDQDFLVPLQQSQLLHKALLTAGLDSELLVVEGKGHGGFDTREVRPRVLQFFEKHLK